MTLIHQGNPDFLRAGRSTETPPFAKKQRTGHPRVILSAPLAVLVQPIGNALVEGLQDIFERAVFPLAFPHLSPLIQRASERAVTTILANLDPPAAKHPGVHVRIADGQI